MTVDIVYYIITYNILYGEIKIMEVLHKEKKLLLILIVKIKMDLLCIR